VIPGSPRGKKISPFSPQFRGIDTGQPNPLAIGCSAGITVVAVADGHDPWLLLEPAQQASPSTATGLPSIGAESDLDYI